MDVPEVVMSHSEGRTTPASWPPCASDPPDSLSPTCPTNMHQLYHNWHYFTQLNVGQGRDGKLRHRGNIYPFALLIRNMALSGPAQMRTTITEVTMATGNNIRALKETVGGGLGRWLRG